MKKRKKKNQPLNPRQKAFVDHFHACGNATQAARMAGYEGTDQSLAVMGSRLLKHVKVRAAIEASAKPAEERRIATAEQIQQLWSEVLNNQRVPLSERLKASELLAKTQGQFIKKTINEGVVTVRVVRGDGAPAGLQQPEKGEEA